MQLLDLSYNNGFAWCVRHVSAHSSEPYNRCTSDKALGKSAKVLPLCNFVIINFNLQKLNCA